MKKNIWLGVGSICLVALIFVYVLLINKGDEEGTETTGTAETEKLISMTQDDIVFMSYTLDGELIEWRKVGDSWKLASDENFPTNDSAVNHIVSVFSSLTSERNLEDIENLKDYGLDKPVNQIILMDADGKKEVVSIGNINISTTYTYVYLNDDTSTIYTVTNDLGSILEADLFDYALSEEYPTIASSNIYEMNVTKEKDSFYVYSDTDSSTGWSVKDGYGNEQNADAMEVSSLQSSLSGLGFSKYYDYDCNDFSVYGLDKPQMTIEVKYTEQIEVENDEIEETEDSSEKSLEDSTDATETVYETVKKSVKLYVGDMDENNVYYVRMDGSSEIHGISQSTLNNYMNAKPFEYWSLTMDSIGISDLDYLEVVYDDKTYELQRIVEEVENEDGEAMEETETTTTYYVNDREVNSTIFLEFFRSAAEIECQNRLEQTQRVNNPELELKYYGEDGSFVCVKYGERDANFYNVTDQDGNSGIVNKMMVKELINKLIALVNGIEK